MSEASVRSFAGAMLDLIKEELEKDSEDPEGLRVFYYLVQDLKALVFSLISLHFKVSLVALPLRRRARTKADAE